MNRMNKKIPIVRVFLIAAAMWLMLHPYPLRAESNDQSNFSMTVPEVRSVTAGSAMMVFTPDLTQILNGETTPQNLDTTVSTNVDWVLTIRGSQSNWTGPWSKPVGDIFWKYGAGDYTALTTLSADVTSGEAVDGGSYPISIKIALDLVADEPGEYSYQYIVIELTAP